MNHFLAVLIVITNILSNSFGHTNRQELRWDPVPNNKNYYFQDNNVEPHQKDFGSNYKYDYTNVASNSYHSANTKDANAEPEIQQFASTQYQPNYEEIYRNHRYKPAELQSYQFPVKPQPNYQYVPQQYIPNRTPNPKVIPQYYYYMILDGQNSASNQNTYNNFGQPNQYVPNTNSGYNTYKYLSHPHINKNMHFTTDGHKSHESNTYGLNNRMYNLGYQTGYDSGNQGYNLYENRYHQNAPDNEFHYVYMPVRDSLPMYYMPYVSNNIAPVSQY